MGNSLSAHICCFRNKDAERIALLNAQPPLSETPEKVVALLEEIVGKEMFGKIIGTWKKEALPKANKAQLAYFLSLAETSPQEPDIEKHADTTVGHMFEMLCKMVLYAPDVWYEVATGCAGDKPPEGLKVDYSKIGVAFDASSRLRRAGIEYFHEKFTDLTVAKYGLANAAFYVTDDGCELMALDKLPKQEENSVRIVAVSDTHLCHRSLKLPAGDLLIHAGDLSYEESRSKDARCFEEYVKYQPSKGKEFEDWFKASGLAAADALAWLGNAPGFKHRLLCGGNHDFILEQMGNQNAKDLCQSYGISYLFTEDQPTELKVGEGLWKVWGSGVSAQAGLDASRAVLSGNAAFQVSTEESDAFLEKCAHITPGSVDIMVTHSPPEGLLLGKKNKTLPSINQLISKVKPSLYVCGHAHNEKDPAKERWANIDGVCGVNAAVVATWNNFFGAPIVIDRKPSA